MDDKALLAACNAFHGDDAIVWSDDVVANMRAAIDAYRLAALPAEPVAWMELVQAGFDDWANKPHNAKWARKIDGTPIPNDVVVCIAERLRAAAVAGAAPTKPRAWRVHSPMVARNVNSQGKFPAKDEWLYPAAREAHAKEAAKILRAECEPLFAAPAPTVIAGAYDPTTQPYDEPFRHVDAPSRAEVLEAAKLVHDTFAKDLEQGYRTKDKEFAVSILGRALAGGKP